MSDQLTDIIRSFIGYWHMDDVVNKMPLELLGSPVLPSSLDEIVVLPPAAGLGERAEFQDLTPMIAVEEFQSSGIATISSGAGGTVSRHVEYSDKS